MFIQSATGAYMEPSCTDPAAESEPPQIVTSNQKLYQNFYQRNLRSAM